MTLVLFCGAATFVTGLCGSGGFAQKAGKKEHVFITDSGSLKGGGGGGGGEFIPEYYSNVTGRKKRENSALESTHVPTFSYKCTT